MTLRLPRWLSGKESGCQLDLGSIPGSGRSPLEEEMATHSIFNLYVEYIMRNAGLEETQVESRLLGEISITSDMQMTPPLWQKVKRN